MNDLRRLAEAATPGPWVADMTSDGEEFFDGDEPHEPTGWFRDCGLGEVDTGDYSTLRYADAAYIAACNPEVVLALLDRLATLEALLATGVDIATRQAADLDGAQRLNRDLFAIVGEAAVETGRGPWPTNGGERTYLAVPAVIEGEETT